MSLENLVIHLASQLIIFYFTFSLLGFTPQRDLFEKSVENPTLVFSSLDNIIGKSLFFFSFILQQNLPKEYSDTRGMGHTLMLLSVCLT